MCVTNLTISRLVGKLWALDVNIQHSVKSTKELEMKTEDSVNTQVLATLLVLLKAATPNEVTCLYRNGSVWIYRSHVESKSISKDSILFLGPRNDGITREIASDMILLVDYDGLADGGVVETEIDSDATEEEIQETFGGWPILTVEEAKSELIQIAKTDCDINLEDFLAMC
jgi:hypothetical protein